MCSGPRTKSHGQGQRRNMNRSADAVSGFGSLKYAQQLDADMWEQLMLQTVQIGGGQISWPRGVAEKAALGQPEPTQAGLAILNELVRGPSDLWELHVIAEHTEHALGAAAALRNTTEYRKLRTALIESGLQELPASAAA